MTFEHRYITIRYKCVQMINFSNYKSAAEYNKTSKPDLIHHYPHKKKPVPSQEYDSSIRLMCLSF